MCKYFRCKEIWGGFYCNYNIGLNDFFYQKCLEFLKVIIVVKLLLVKRIGGMLYFMLFKEVGFKLSGDI